MQRKIFRELLSIDAANKKLYSNFKPRPLSAEITPLNSAGGRVLAEDIRSLLDVPPFDRASMDGYAVKAEDTYKAGEINPVKLKIIGNIRAGVATTIEISNGQTAEIATGAPLPLGSDAVVMVEHTITENGSVNIFKPVPPYENIMLAGSDINRGEIILRKGEILTPREIGV